MIGPNDLGSASRPVQARRDGVEEPVGYIADFVRRQTHSLNHAVGSCKMGVHAMAVVDPQLHMHGRQGLRVVSASIMPTIGRGHMNAPTSMIAARR